MHSVDFLNIQNIFYRIYQFFSALGMPKEIFDYLMSYWPIVALISFLLSIILLIFIIYYFFKLKEIEKADKEKYGFIETPDLFEDTSVKNERWLRVLEHLETESPTEWRSAILEADIILDEMTKKMGYHGDNLGERLNSVEKSDFLTLNQAWEAHKVRNMIAHEGSGYILNKREAKRVIDLYRQVFEEFEFI
ncbi:hypothetical protein L6261_01850 [Candidatus Parcubacteria bacterium]|nr:hypothetical protein [Candidatus Parcubacteria bacterium]